MFKVHAVIQSTYPGSTDPPAVVVYYNGDDKAKAISALATIVADDVDSGYTETLSATVTFTDTKARRI